MASAAIRSALKQLNVALVESKKPLAIILAGHNGSGKSTLWYEQLASSFQIPLVNADRMMLSILPEVDAGKRLPAWARNLRDSTDSWMRIAQGGVNSFVANAMLYKVPFAQETVFSHWKRRKNGSIESKIDLIVSLQRQNYFVLLAFVGLSSSMLSAARVASRKANGGHDVDRAKIDARFPRTQRAIRFAVSFADYSILFDNSRSQRQAFTIARIQEKRTAIYDIRDRRRSVPHEILEWLNVVSPRPRRAVHPKDF